jgi:Caspase recruitment domain
VILFFRLQIIEFDVDDLARKHVNEWITTLNGIIDKMRPGIANAVDVPVVVLDILVAKEVLNRNAAHVIRSNALSYDRCSQLLDYIRSKLPEPIRTVINVLEENHIGGVELVRRLYESSVDAFGRGLVRTTTRSPTQATALPNDERSTTPTGIQADALSPTVSEQAATAKHTAIAVNPSEDEVRMLTI